MSVFGTTGFVDAVGIDADVGHIPLPYLLPHPFLPRPMQPMHRDHLLESQPLSDLFGVGIVFEKLGRVTVAKRLRTGACRPLCADARRGHDCIDRTEHRRLVHRAAGQRARNNSSPARPTVLRSLIQFSSNSMTNDASRACRISNGLFSSMFTYGVPGA